METMLQELELKQGTVWQYDLLGVINNRRGSLIFQHISIKENLILSRLEIWILGRKCRIFFRNRYKKRLNQLKK
jgi:hypothetical protein